MSNTNQDITQETVEEKKPTPKKKKESVILATMGKMAKSVKKKEDKSKKSIKEEKIDDTPAVEEATPTVEENKDIKEENIDKAEVTKPEKTEKKKAEKKKPEPKTEKKKDDKKKTELKSEKKSKAKKKEPEAESQETGEISNEVITTEAELPSPEMEQTASDVIIEEKPVNEAEKAKVDKKGEAKPEKKKVEKKKTEPKGEKKDDKKKPEPKAEKKKPEPKPLKKSKAKKDEAKDEPTEIITEEKTTEPKLPSPVEETTGEVIIEIEKTLEESEIKVETAKVDKKSDSKPEKKKVEKKKPEPKSEKKKDDKKKPEPKAEKKKNEPKTDEKDKKEVTKKVDSKNEKQEAKKEENKPSEKKKPEKWSIKNLGGALFAKMLRGGASKLHANAEEVNKLNVFPVPDGDTGDNMSMTIESGVASLDNIDTDDLAEVLKVASRGMLLGARGNSGVILSQFFAGMAKGLENVETADAKKLAHALEIGVQQAYTSVMTPTEGTILTVAREAVEYAVSRVTKKSTVQSLFSDLVNEMNASLERTPEILPILGEAGVVDSGGAGLLYIIDGLNRVLNGEDVDEGEISHLPKPKTDSNEIAEFGPDSIMEFGYCTELLVQLMNKKIAKNPFDLDSLKIYLASLGDSIVAFQTESIVKIHVHTLRPDRVLGYMRKYGEFISVKIENMSLQHTELQADEEKKEEEAPTTPPKKYGIVAVSNGAGISELFREIGTDEIVEGGQTNNPSTNDFIAAFDKINAENIFVFPNNGNIIMAAGQAAEIYEKAKVYVVPTKSIGAGYVAMSTMSFDMSEPDDLMNEAKDAIDRITAAYISPAVRDADMNGVHVTEGDTMGIINKEIIISGPDKMASTFGLIDTMLADGSKFMLTTFYGKDATDEERKQLEEYMSTNHPTVEAYFIDGGQEIYPFLFVVE